MNTERDTTRIVQSWLESGSTAIPDRVLDAVLAELPSRPQRRSKWSLWRSLQMKPIIPVAVSAAVVLLAVVLGSQFLSSEPGIGSPSSPPPPSNAISGEVGFVLGDDPGTLNVDAVADGSSLAGKAKVSFGDFQEVPELEDMFVIELQCARQFDDTTTILGGTVETSTHVGLTPGTRAAIILRDGSPQELVFWFEDAAPGDDCAGFVDGISDQDVINSGFVPVSGGEISLP